jgi:hypothetical protein
LDVVWADSAYAEIISNPNELERLRQVGFKTEIVHESVSSFYQSRLPQADQGGYKTLAEMYAYLDGIIADHPDIVSPKQSIGLTYEGRDMWAVKISDNPTLDEEEPEILFTAGTHCREVGTPEILFYYMDHLTNNYATDTGVRDLVDSREIWLILACNPDGYYYNEVTTPEGGGMWRKNRRPNGDGSYGIDINRNFGYMWGYDNAGSSPVGYAETYRGTAPFSEPETQHIRDFILDHDFSLTCHYHQYQNVFIYPWGYRPATCADDDIYAALGDSINAMNGYVHGPVSTLMYAVNGGVFDWEYGDVVSKPRIFGTSIEAGSYSDGFWPTLARLEVLKQENLEPMLFLTRQAGGLYTMRPPTSPQLVDLPVSVDGTEYSVQWAHDDTYNPAVVYELTEYQKRRVITDPCESLQSWDADGFTVTAGTAASLSSDLYSGTGDEYTASLTALFPYLVKPGDKLTFNMIMATETHHDYCYVEISTDGENFATIPGDLTSNLNPYGLNRGNGMTGLCTIWLPVQFDLSAYVGQSVLFRFVYETDAFNFLDGWQVDDIHPHVVFDSTAVISSSLGGSSYTLMDRPMGLYAYSVRAKDAQGQWSARALATSVDVLGEGKGNVDLDGVTGSVADLALFAQYFQQGLPAFNVYPTVQVGETDANCDDLALSANDLVALSEVVLGAQTACYAATLFSPDRHNELAATVSLGDRPGATLRTLSESVFRVELQSSTFRRDDTAWVDIALTQAEAGLLGFQFHLEYDASALALEAIERGCALANWQFFDHNLTQTVATADLRIAAVAQYNGPPVQSGDIILQPAPLTLVRLKFTFLDPDLSEPISFAWESCGDNALVCGQFAGEALLIDSLLLSKAVFSSNGSEITGVDPRYGGADYTCFYDLFGNSAVTAVDFADGSITYDAGCCVGRVGDANGEGDYPDEVTLGDVMLLVDVKFISGDCSSIACLSEADVNQDGGADPNCDDHVTLGDIMTLVDFLFISGAPVSDCL